MRTAALILVVFMVGISLYASRLNSATSPRWQIRYSECLPLTPTSLTGMWGWFFEFPQNAFAPDGNVCSVNYVTEPYTLSIVGKTITMTAQVVNESGVPVFNYDFYGNNGPTPANARLYFERSFKGHGCDIACQPDWFRWWFNADTFYLDSSGSVTIVAPLDSAQWSDAGGVSASSDIVDWEAALMSPGAIGMTFGGGWFFGHGVNVSGGTARFILTGYSVQ